MDQLGRSLSRSCIREVKREIRVIGIDHCFTPPATEARVIGVIFRGKWLLDGLLQTSIKSSGLDSTEKIAEMIMKSPHYNQIRVIMLSSIELANGNIIDIKELHNRTKLPVIYVSREKFSKEQLKESIKKHEDWKQRWNSVQHVGCEHMLMYMGSPIYFYVAGIDPRLAREVIEKTTREGIPEALRVARLVVEGLKSLRRHN